MTLVSGAVVIALLGASPAFAGAYTFTALPAGFTATALNGTGVIAGVAVSGGQLLPAVLDGGSVSFPSTPRSGGSPSSLTGIDDAGDLLGLASNGRSPFLISNGALVPFAAPGNTSAGTQAYGLNGLRQVVGSALVFDGSGSHSVAYLSSGNTYVVLGGPGDPTLLPRALNDLGIVVGTTAPSPDHPVQQAFSFDGGVVTTFGAPGSISTSGFAVNDGGEIAGQYELPGGSLRGYTLSAGTFSDITGPGGEPFLPVGLNDAGQLVGAFAGGGPSYLATPEVNPAPVPEPATGPLVSGMLALVAGASRLRAGARRPVASSFRSSK